MWRHHQRISSLPSSASFRPGGSSAHNSIQSCTITTSCMTAAALLRVRTHSRTSSGQLSLYSLSATSTCTSGSSCSCSPSCLQPSPTSLTPVRYFTFFGKRLLGLASNNSTATEAAADTNTTVSTPIPLETTQSIPAEPTCKTTFCSSSSSTVTTPVSTDTVTPSTSVTKDAPLGDAIFAAAAAAAAAGLPPPVVAPSATLKHETTAQQPMTTQVSETTPTTKQGNQDASSQAESAAARVQVNRTEAKESGMKQEVSQQETDMKQGNHASSLPSMSAIPTVSVPIVEASTLHVTHQPVSQHESTIVHAHIAPHLATTHTPIEQLNISFIIPSTTMTAVQPSVIPTFIPTVHLTPNISISTPQTNTTSIESASSTHSTTVPPIAPTVPTMNATVPPTPISVNPTVAATSAGAVVAKEEAKVSAQAPTATPEAVIPTVDSNSNTVIISSLENKLLPFPTSHLLWMADGTQRTIGSMFENKQVLIVGFVGAFLSLCQKQIPDFIAQKDIFHKYGIDAIYGVSVNDHAVLKSFAQEQHIPLDQTINFIADFDASFVSTLGLSMNLGSAGMGTRSRRFALLVNNLQVQHLFLEADPAQLTVASAAHVLKQVKQNVEAANKNKNQTVSASTNVTSSPNAAPVTASSVKPAATSVALPNAPKLDAPASSTTPTVTTVIIQEAPRVTATAHGVASPTTSSTVVPVTIAVVDTVINSNRQASNIDSTSPGVANTASAASMTSPHEESQSIVTAVPVPIDLI